MPTYPVFTGLVTYSYISITLQEGTKHFNRTATFGVRVWPMDVQFNNNVHKSQTNKSIHNQFLEL